MKAHASMGDRMQLGALRHQVQPTVRAIREGLGFICHVLAIAAIEEGGQVYLWAWLPFQTTYRPTDTRECVGIAMQAGNAHRDLERQPIRADPATHKPAKVCSLNQSKPVPPTFRAVLQSVVQRAYAPATLALVRQDVVDILCYDATVPPIRSCNPNAGERRMFGPFAIRIVNPFCLNSRSKGK